MLRGSVLAALLLLCVTVCQAFTVSHIRLNHELQAIAIDSLVQRLDHNPVLHCHCLRVQQELELRHERGDYRELMDPVLFAQRIGKDVTHLLMSRPVLDQPLLLFRQEFMRYQQRERHPDPRELESILVFETPPES